MLPQLRNKQNKNSSPISVSTLMQLKTLFDNKGWLIDEDNTVSFFNRYISTLSILDEKQQDFLISLSHRFLYIPIDRYLELVLEPLKELRKEDPNKKLFFTCCLPKEDLGKTKSSQAVLYQIKGTTIRSRINLRPSRVIEKWDDTTCHEFDTSNYQVVLVDDFIGTGETALSAIKYIKDTCPNIEDSRISVLSIIAMDEGIRLIRDKGHKSYVSIICKKGITDYYNGTELSNAINLMRSIEKEIKGLNDRFSFGYNQSESLVCMNRCPNNTFPIYWKSDKSHNAPYER